MVYLLCIMPFLLAMTVLADYDIDNSDKSVIYTFPPTGSGWTTYSVATGQLELEFSNSTGNYTVVLDASHCYDQNYAQGYCGTSDNCVVQIPFTGSGITMYVFNAGLSGIAASFSVDGGKTVSNTTQSPPPPTYQQSNVSLYDIQGLTSGNHTMVMTVLDWGGAKTYMKFDYAHINETLVEAPATTSSTPSQTSTSASQTSSQTPSQTFAGNSSTKINLGGVIGGTLAGVVLLAGILTGFFCLRKKRRTLPPHPETFSPVQTFHVDPFTSEYLSNPAPPRTHVVAQGKQTSASTGLSPLTRSAILRDALVPGSGSSEPTHSTSSQSIRSGMSSPTPPMLQPLRREIVSVEAEASDLNLNNTSRPTVADAESPFVDHPRPSRFNLTADQLDVIDRLRADNLPAETISRVIEGFAFSHLRVDDDVTGRSIISTAAPPPSYRR